jgi:RNA polymerase sigma-70 factor (ECF subfamily)
MTEKPHAPLEDTAIIRLYNARDERAISETDRKYGSYCTAVSMNILDSYPDAEECVNDTYLHTWNSIPPQNPPSLRNFLGKIVRNLSISRWRTLHSQKRDRDLTVALDELEAEGFMDQLALKYFGGGEEAADEAAVEEVPAE